MSKFEHDGCEACILLARTRGDILERTLKDAVALLREGHIHDTGFAHHDRVGAFLRLFEECWPRLRLVTEQADTPALEPPQPEAPGDPIR